MNRKYMIKHCDSRFWHTGH